MPLATGDTPHTPLLQVVVSHELPVAQTLQLTPPPPQAVMVLPALHTVPEQHPAQSLAVQVPPQPSSAPAHLPLQLGWQTHCPLWQTLPVAQVPQEPPHMSGPHCLPAHWGVHAVQVELRQVPLVLVQSTHATPLAPHWVCWVPATHPDAGSQQPAQLLPLQPQMASGQGPLSSSRSAGVASSARSSGGAWSATTTF